MEPAQSSEESKTVFVLSKAGRVIVIVFLLLIVAVPSYYFYNQYQKSKEVTQIPQKSQLETLVESVGKLMELPQGEQPTIATVSDITKLQSQVFFTNAQNGDKVLIYSKSKKAILYRPSINKIIEVSVVNIESSNPAPIASVSASPSVAPTASPIGPILVPTPASTLTPTTTPR